MRRKSEESGNSTRQLPYRGRGATLNPENRFFEQTIERAQDGFDDGWSSLSPVNEKVITEVYPDTARSIISYNQSPDIPYDRSINPYRGCEHGCIYCFARPTHAYLDFSPGVDFETRLLVKHNAADLLIDEISKPSYRCAPIAIGMNTDAYQPIEREHNVTRSLIEVLATAGHPFSIVTKSALVERDVDLLAELAQDNLVCILVSLTTMDNALSRRMEPRAAAPHRRLKSIKRLTEAGIPVGVLFAPVIPFLNDHEMEQIVATAHDAGALSVRYVLLRMPHEIKPLFEDWLEQHYPLKAKRILNRMRDMHDGQLYRAEFGNRLRGTGQFADLLSNRLNKALRQYEFPGLPALDCSQFRPGALSSQMELF